MFKSITQLSNTLVTLINRIVIIISAYKSPAAVHGHLRINYLYLANRIGPGQHEVACAVRRAACGCERACVAGAAGLRVAGAPHRCTTDLLSLLHLVYSITSLYIFLKYIPQYFSKIIIKILLYSIGFCIVKHNIRPSRIYRRVRFGRPEYPLRSLPSKL